MLPAMCIVHGSFWTAVAQRSSWDDTVCLQSLKYLQSGHLQKVCYSCLRLLDNMVHYLNYRGNIRQLFEDRINIFEY